MSKDNIGGRRKGKFEPSKEYQNSFLLFKKNKNKKREGRSSRATIWPQIRNCQFPCSSWGGDDGKKSSSQDVTPLCFPMWGLPKIS